jgi:hypothetical protein
MIGLMQTRDIFVRYGGLPIAILGLSLIMASFFLEDINGDILDLFQRAGFGILLIGLLILFLFSIKTIPREFSVSFIMTQGLNISRLLKGMNLHGKGVYFPPYGRLRKDRVYIPLEKHNLPLPEISDETVFNVGTTSPSMGLVMIPPGKDFVDSVEKITGKRFRDDHLKDSQEALQRLSKGTGMFKEIEVRDRKSTIELSIVHEKDDSTCQDLWTENDMIHGQVGCPLCSSVICATARIAKVPLRITDVQRKDRKVLYQLEKVVK